MKKIMRRLQRRFGSVSGRPARRGEQRGSALLITMLILVVLGLLGITYLVLSDTENLISVNQRDDQQVLYVAEGGVEVVKSWFDQPKASENPLVPAQSDVILDRRRGDSDWDDTADLDGSAGDVYTGGSKGGVTRLFEKPYRGKTSYTFWGYPADSNGLGPDVVLVDDPGNDNDYLDRLNRLFNPQNVNSLGRVSISEVRVFRPPLAKDLKMRLGVATIEVDAVKRDRSGRVISARTVRDTVQEFPYPGPRGAIESAGTIDLNGNFTPHWGFVESEDTIDFKEGKTFAAVPRDPDFPYGDIYRKFQDFNPVRYADMHKKDSDGVPGDDLATAPTGCGGQQTNLISELVAATRNGTPNPPSTPHWLQDPWLVYRTAKWFIGTCDPNAIQPWDWDPGRDFDGEIISFPPKNKLTGCLQCNEKGDASNMMQKQPVKFPVILYAPWKKAARSGKKNTYYYSYAGDGAGEPLFRRNGGAETREARKWINTEITGNNPGLHFFDTVNAKNPQPYGLEEGEVPEGILTDTVKLKQGGGKGGGGGSGGGGGGGGGQDFLAEGFIFINAETVDSTGVGPGVDLYVNMPGEPFLDIGIDLDGDGEVCDNSTCCPDAPADKLEKTHCNERDTINNGIWDVDLDDCVASTTQECDSDGANYRGHANWQDFVEAHRYADKTIPHVGVGAFTDEAPQFLRSQPNSDMPEWPHEPFLNFRYPPKDGHSSGGAGSYANSDKLINYEVAVDYDAEENTDLRRPLDNGSGPGCNAKTPCAATDYTDTGYDINGSVFKLPLNLDGVMYNEGGWDGTGNFVGYGSLLMKTGFRGRGTIHMYFDESLIKDQWPPDRWQLPRVFTSSRETETDSELQRLTGE